MVVELPEGLLAPATEADADETDADAAGDEAPAS